MEIKTGIRDASYYAEEYIRKERSYQDIALEWGTYPNKIRREIIRLGYPTRDKSAAQKAALRSGRHTHPTEGRKRTEAEKAKIGDALQQNWRSMGEEERNRRAQLGRAQWNDMSEAEKKELQNAALEAVRATSRDGSKLEKFLLKSLQKAGHDVLFHSEDLIPNTRLHADLYFPAYKIIIEIDGPSHFFPIWGEESLRKNIEADNKKNERLLSYGYTIIRVKHLTKTLSQVQQRNILSKILALVERRESIKQKLEEIEVI